MTVSGICRFHRTHDIKFLLINSATWCLYEARNRILHHGCKEYQDTGRGRRRAYQRRIERVTEEMVAGLRLGADDYIAKPFSMKNVIARIEAVMRRVHVKNAVPSRTLFLSARCFAPLASSILRPPLTAVSPHTWPNDCSLTYAQESNPQGMGQRMNSISRYLGKGQSSSSTISSNSSTCVRILSNRGATVS